MEIEILLRFLRYTMGVSAYSWDGSDAMLLEIEKTHCFSHQAQPLLTVKGLHAAMGRIRPAHLYEAEDILGIHFCVFLFKGTPVWIGPFVKKEWDDADAGVRMVGAGLPASYLLSYKLYYCSYGVLDENAAVRNITGAITALSADEPPYIYRKFSGVLGQNQPNLTAREPMDFDSTVRRYQLENSFLSMIEEGRTEAALEVWKRLDKIPQMKELAVVSLQDMVANATVLRTLARKAAERGGVHPAVVNSIAVAYAQKTYAARNQNELVQIIPDMIREFSDAVHAAKEKQYSPMIKLVVNYLQLHISQEIDMQQLADLAECTSIYLGRRFKEETGMTVAQFLALERCRTAADLLIRTNLPVQDISAHVGYLDNNYFAKVFKKLYGKTPTDYRNKLYR